MVAGIRPIYFCGRRIPFVLQWPETDRHQSRIMNTVIVYYSFSGNNELLARHLQQQSGADLVRIVEIKRRTTWTIFLDMFLHRLPRIHLPKIHPGQYDHFILLTPIWMGRVASPMRTFLKQESDIINSYSFISLCGGSNPDLRKELTRLIGKAPLRMTELTTSAVRGTRSAEQLETMEHQLAEQDLVAFEQELSEFLVGPNPEPVPVKV